MCSVVHCCPCNWCKNPVCQHMSHAVKSQTQHIANTWLTGPIPQRWSVFLSVMTFQVISDLLHFKGSHKHEFDSRWKSFNLVKKSMENRVRTLAFDYFTFFTSVLPVDHSENICFMPKAWATLRYSFSCVWSEWQLKVLCLVIVFVASRQKATHQSSANRQSHASAWGKPWSEKRCVFLHFMLLHVLLFNCGSFCVISCESWQWKDASTEVFTRSWWRTCWGFPQAPTVR